MLTRQTMETLLSLRLKWPNCDERFRMIKLYTEISSKVLKSLVLGYTFLWVGIKFVLSLPKSLKNYQLWDNHLKLDTLKSCASANRMAKQLCSTHSKQYYETMFTKRAYELSLLKCMCVFQVTVYCNVLDTINKCFYNIISMFKSNFISKHRIFTKFSPRI